MDQGLIQCLRRLARISDILEYVIDVVSGIIGSCQSRGEAILMKLSQVLEAFCTGFGSSGFKIYRELPQFSTSDGKMMCGGCCQCLSRPDVFATIFG